MRQFVLSQIKALPFDFEAAVKDFVAAKKAHLATEGVPAPMAPHGLVEHAVRRVPGSIEEQRVDDFVADYEIVDDTPPPPTLDRRKQALAHQLEVNASALIATIMPPLKARLWGLQAGEIEQIEQKKRSGAQKAFLAEQIARTAKVQAIVRHLATTEAEIHDLTEQTIADWAPQPFPV